jgi:hypothetical protein
MKSVTWHVGWAAAVTIMAVFAVQAQTLTGLNMDPVQGRTGQPVKLTALLDASKGAPNCNLRIKWGDGTPDIHFHVNQNKDVPMTLTHVYTKPGTYPIEVAARTRLPALKCMGYDQKLAYVVKGPIGATVKGTTVCPQGFKLKGKIHPRTGAFACTAVKKGTKLPAEPLTCPGSLTFFAHLKQGQLGCKFFPQE